MSFLGRLQDMLGMGSDYSPFDDEPGYFEGAAQGYGVPGKPGVAPDNVIEMPGLATWQSELVVMEPQVFEEIPDAITALRERKTVILNLSRMEPDQAQRSVDYVAGGVFALDGHQERIGPSVFLFTPNSVQINNYSGHPGGLPLVSTGARGPFVSPGAGIQPLADRLDVRSELRSEGRSEGRSTMPHPQPGRSPSSSTPF